jgi:hypothetical protein
MKEDWMKACGFSKILEGDLWFWDALVKEEIERNVINTGMVSSDEEADEAIDS